MNPLSKDIISSEVFLLLFLFSSGFVSFIYLFIFWEHTSERVLQFIGEEINMGVARITEETSITGGRKIRMLSSRATILF